LYSLTSASPELPPRPGITRLADPEAKRDAVSHGEPTIRAEHMNGTTLNLDLARCAFDILTLVQLQLDVKWRRPLTFQASFPRDSRR
jgi:hypothetical protein